jgi:hypothetical protein
MKKKDQGKESPYLLRAIIVSPRGLWEQNQPISPRLAKREWLQNAKSPRNFVGVVGFVLRSQACPRRLGHTEKTPSKKRGFICPSAF